jgi:hypothetical protein
VGDEILYQGKQILPVGEIVAKSYFYAWNNRNALILPVAVLLLADLFSAWVGTRITAAENSPTIAAFAPAVFSIWLFLLASMAFAVGIHRRVLLGEAYQDLALFRFDRRLASYIWTLIKISLALGLLCLILIVPISIVQGVTTAVDGQPPSLDVLLPAAWVAISIDLLFGIRLMLALPGAAVGGVHSIRRSWRMTRGNWGRLIMVFFAVTLPFQLPSLAVMQAHLGETSWALIVFNAVLSVISVPIFTVALSLSYEKLAPPKPAEEPQI